MKKKNYLPKEYSPKKIYVILIINILFFGFLSFSYMKMIYQWKEEFSNQQSEMSPSEQQIQQKNIRTQITISFISCLTLNIILIGSFLYLYQLNQRKNKKLYEIAYIDSITKLGNEVYFKSKASEIINSKESFQYLAIIDINKFKHFNKIYDNEFCDELLLSFGKKIKNILPKNNLTCHLGRDEFVSIFTYPKEIKDLMKKMFQEMENFQVFTMKIPLNITVGLYKITKNDHDIMKILDKAYTAHLKAKGPYDNNYFVFDEELENKVLEEQKIELEMENALKNHEFKVAYQPKIYVKDGKLAGAEALVRWYHENTIISPNKFIPLFEKNQFILKLDLYVFETVCQNLQEWKEKYKNIPTISINVSKQHFLDEKFIEKYVEITDKYQIDRQKIDLEITESTTVDENINIIKIIENIKKKGFMISLDDFGTGYSSLSMLQQLDIDIIKIDKTFIDQANLKSNKNIINYITLMSKKLGVKTIVEGIETRNQVEFIQKLKCDMIQGYYYSKPISKNDFEEYMEKNKGVKK